MLTTLHETVLCDRLASMSLTLVRDSLAELVNKQHALMVVARVRLLLDVLPEYAEQLIDEIFMASTVTVLAHQILIYVTLVKLQILPISKLCILEAGPASE